eukprot:TRINITY_DN11036_c0_g1_i1.p1 TRINITY_DN11036_c0_g1~~TRINITY_DN11036_c0_g1_i1.p1  ORF type:complete len:930 (-),score=108.05 TRINITY_DN11036_c0_g1_i1:221-3010(-)
MKSTNELPVADFRQLFKQVITQQQMKRSADEKPKKDDCQCSFPSLGTLQTRFLRRMAQLFDSHGRFVACHPNITIIACVFLTLLSTLGFLNFTAKSDTLSLWIPEISETKDHVEWLNKNFPPDTRYHSAIVKADNVLSKEGINTVYLLTKRIQEVRTKDNVTWEDMCKKIAIPVTIEEVSWVAWGFNVVFGGCPHFLEICLELSILKILSPAEEVTDEFISNLNQSEILRLINESDKKEDVLQYLGGVTYDMEGNIVGAKATKIDLISETNITEALLNPDPSTSVPVTNVSMMFEEDLKVALLNTTGIPEGIDVSVIVSRSFDDVINENIIGNYNLLFSGFAIMFVYVLIMLGKFNCVEHRVWLSLAGLTGIVLGSVFCMGLCSAFGLMFTQLHNVLPFLMLGIGIDDMFVLVQCYENLSVEEKKEDIAKRFGKTLSYAGMAVSVTSVTNIVAFALGATTVIPALRSFCLFCSVGILAIFIYTLTFFTACMVLDQKRIDERRDGCFCCWRHGESWTPNKWTKKNYLDIFLKKLAEISTHRACKVAITIITFSLFGLACYGISKLEQRFEERWLIPDDSYLAKWFDDRQEFFNNKGERGTIYVAEFEMNGKQLDKVQSLVRKLANQTDIITEVDTWALGFSDFYDDSMNSTTLQVELGKYLHSKDGLQFHDRFEFANGARPKCNEEAPDVVMFKIQYQHPLFSGPLEHVPAMNKVKDLIKEVNIEGRVFAKSIKYEFWEVDEILSAELIRSVTLALVCVFLIVIFMLANLTAAFLVLFCVMFTLVDVMGFMYFWGLTIDTTSCMLLIVCIGLSVDYAAHIAHGFLEQDGGDIKSREARLNLRTQKTLLKIGPAVFYGGFSTLLATILLAGSDYYLFIAFFKVFFLVVVFGLFHGLVFLPVVLCLVGPTHAEDGVHNEKYELEKLKPTIDL